MILTFHTHNYSVTYAGNTLTLLRKEFALLHYLYTHANRSFTRSELLDAVWTLEAPSDRTVDDHIYRLRKKLKGWKHALTIDTVKGYGYILRLHIVEEIASPLLHDEEFRQLTSGLLSKYHLYGQGEALEVLLQQKSLGIQANPSMQFSLSFMKGDVWKLIQAPDVTFSERALFLFHIYLLIADNRKKTVALFEKALQKELFSANTREEAILLAPVFFPIFSRDFDKAIVYLDAADQVVTSPDHGFYPFLQLNRMMIDLCLKKTAAVNMTIEKMKRFFLNKPYQREMGLFYVLKGVFAIQQGEKQTGRKDIEEGMRITRITRFKSHMFLALQTCLFFLEHDVDDPETHKKIEKEWLDLTSEYHIEELKNEIEKQILDNL